MCLQQCQREMGDRQEQGRSHCAFLPDSLARVPPRFSHQHASHTDSIATMDNRDTQQCIATSSARIREVEGISPCTHYVQSAGAISWACWLFDVVISTQAMHNFYSYDGQSVHTTADIRRVSYLRFHTNNLLGSTGIYHPKRDGAQVKSGRVLIFHERELQAQLCRGCRRCV